jgi:hypothetical protein
LDFFLSDFVAAVWSLGGVCPCLRGRPSGQKQQHFFVPESFSLFTSSCVCVVSVLGCLFVGELLHELSKRQAAQAEGTSHCMYAFAAMQ